MLSLKAHWGQMYLSGVHLSVFWCFASYHSRGYRYPTGYLQQKSSSDSLDHVHWRTYYCVTGRCSCIYLMNVNAIQSVDGSAWPKLPELMQDCAGVIIKVTQLKVWSLQHVSIKPWCIRKVLIKRKRIFRYASQIQHSPAAFTSVSTHQYSRKAAICLLLFNWLAHSNFCT